MAFGSTRESGAGPQGFGAFVFGVFGVAGFALPAFGGGPCGGALLVDGLGAFGAALSLGGGVVQAFTQPFTSRVQASSHSLTPSQRSRQSV